MPKTAEPPTLDEVRHEYFCLPQEDAEAPRIEGFVSYIDTDAGRSAAHRFVTRCVECGATTYRPLT